jgi:hypothetical protein
VPSQQMTMFLMDAESPQVAGGRLATGGGIGYWDLGLCCHEDLPRARRAVSRAAIFGNFVQKA